jgi:hypothetical protein
MSRTKELEKRVKALEEFLGIVYSLDDGYASYNYGVNAYRADITLNGELGILKQDYADRKKELIKK